MEARTILGFTVLLVTVICLFLFLWYVLKLPTIDHKMLFGFAILTVLAILALIIALGHVTKDESAGLEVLLGGVISMASGFTYWAFTKDKEPK